MRLTLIPTHQLLPFSGLQIDTIQISRDTIRVLLTSVSTEAACPLCLQPTSRIHSSYTPTIADLPWAILPVQCRLTVRRFFCPNPNCKRRIFGERLPTVVAPFARRTARLTPLLQDLVLQVGGQTGARLAQEHGMPISPRSLLRLGHTAPLATPAPARVVGIDDWAWRKARNYGTLVVDLERQRPIELLPDRDQETVTEWLATHPEVEIISRDRAGAYAEGARQGRPDAIQAADRFHLVVRRFTRHSIPVLDGKGYKGDLWVNDLPGGENQRGQEHVVRKWNGIEDV